MKGYNIFVHFKPVRMLEYFKTILSKVSFDKKLFEKELLKAIKNLITEDLQDFKKWCYDQFDHMHGPILNRCFAAN